VAAEFDEQDIYDVLSMVLLAGRLSPGSRLGEHKLATTFGVTRERVRKVLHRLGHERLISLVPNRGAFVMAPSFSNARSIYEARRIVEAGIVTRLAESSTEPQLRKLRDHLASEQQAARDNNRAASIRLSGIFHLVLAEMTGNDFILRQMQELISRTSMLVAYFEPHSSSICGCDEHGVIVDALSRRDAAVAARSMISHLSMIETRLRPTARDPQESNFERVIRDEMRAQRIQKRNIRSLSRRK
jgi:DNA-binding GntR family transcriptional regulator